MYSIVRKFEFVQLWRRKIRTVQNNDLLKYSIGVHYDKEYVLTVVTIV